MMRAMRLPNSPSEKRLEGGRGGKGGGVDVKPTLHSQASLLSKLDKPMAKA